MSGAAAAAAAVSAAARAVTVADNGDAKLDVAVAAAAASAAAAAAMAVAADTAAELELDEVLQYGTASADALVDDFAASTRAALLALTRGGGSVTNATANAASNDELVPLEFELLLEMVAEALSNLRSVHACQDHPKNTNHHRPTHTATTAK